MRLIREDVHVHAAASEVHARLSDFSTLHEWLPPAFQQVTREGDGARDGFRCRLVLPGRQELMHLLVAETDPPRYLGLAAADATRATAGIAWIISSETAGESHLTVEVFYNPPGGFLGWVADVCFTGAHRRQAFRDALWRFKQLTEQPPSGGWRS